MQQAESSHSLTADRDAITGQRIMSEEEKLYVYLIKGYNKEIRPVRYAHEVIDVSLTYSLMQIQRLVSM